MTTAVTISPLEIHVASEFAAAVKRSHSLHYPWVTPPQTEEAVVLLANRRRGPENYGYVVRRIDSQVLVGYIDITNIIRGVFQSGYLGYYAFSGTERQGYMTEGLSAVVHYAFNELGLHRLEANIQPENASSIALVSGVGFIKEGYSSRYLKLGEHWRDHERWAILAA